MTDRTRWDDPRHERGREDYRYRQQGGGEGSRQSSQFDYRSGQQGGWQDQDYGSDYRSGYGGDYRSSDWRGRQGQHHRDWGEGFGHSQERERGADRPWGGSSGQPGYSGGYDSSDRSMTSGYGAGYGGGMGASAGYGYSRQDDLSARRDHDWGNRDTWRSAGSQSFAADYGMRDGPNYDSRERLYSRAGGAYGGISSQGYGRGYGPDYLGDRRGREDDDRGFFSRAGDEIASWFGDDEAARRREQDQRRDHGYAMTDRSASDHRGRGPSDYTRSDERIREDANDRLTDDSRVDASHISIAVDKGEITLNGTVDSREDKRRAEDLVDRISGVKHVQNNLRVKERERTSSNWIGSAATNTMASGGTTASTMGGSTGTTGMSGTAGTTSGTSHTTGSSSTGTGSTSTTDKTTGSSTSTTGGGSALTGGSGTSGPGGKGPVT